MRRRTLLALSAIMVLAFAASVSGHTPVGETFFAAQFPDNGVPTIDGDPSDWDIVPESPYHIRTDRMSAADASIGLFERGSSDPSDLNMDSVIGWNESSNRLYFLVSVFDDIHNVDRDDVARFWEDDDIEINLNADHTGQDEANLEGEPWNNHYYGFVVPPVEGQFFFPAFPGPEWLQPGSDLLDFGWSFTGEQFGESTYFYEVGMQVIESIPRVENPAQADSPIFDLEEGEVIHFSIDIGDFDEPGQTYDSFWSVSDDRACCSGNSDLFLSPVDPDLEAALADRPTAVEAASWGRIKANLH
jgi:hypothetical protein